MERLESEAERFEPSRLEARLEALDRLDALLPEGKTPGGEAEGDELPGRARAAGARIEAAHDELYAAMRAEIRQGKRPAGLMERAGEAGEVKHGAGYDALDEMVSGVLQLDAPGGEEQRAPELVFYQPTPARHIFELLRRTRLGAGDVLVDLGSGLGHVPLLAAMLTEARAVGVEREAGFVECARGCAERLGLRRASFVCGDAREADLPVGTVFYLYTPFTGSVLREVLGRLRREAAGRRIRVVTFGPCSAVVSAEGWLEAEDGVVGGRVAVFWSRG